MAKIIIHQPEFEAKLKKLRIKTKFIKNCRTPNWIASEREATIIFNETKSWGVFVGHAFDWNNSPEGFMYWYEISRV